LTMGKIIILDENTANKIAAGEVIERPASVIKELVENSIDAGATSVSVEIRNGGISFIRVIDNGSGLAMDDVEIAFERHATSKIRRADDLESISSMGFRGEALASIAAVSVVQMSTRTKDAVQGVSIEVKGGGILDVKPAGCPIGTSITVRELFFNTPARYKFMKKDTTEAGYVADVLSRIALGYPDISFKLVSGGALLLHTPGNGDLKSAIFSVYGADTAKQLIEINYDDGRVKIAGYAGRAELSRSSRSQQSVYINRRYIRSKTITSAIDAAYTTFLMKNRYAFALLDIRVNQALVDVNVHPSKMEVKFSNEQDIYRAVFHAVNSALLNQSAVRTLPGFDLPVKDAYNLNDKGTGKPSYTQQAFGQTSGSFTRTPQTFGQTPGSSTRTPQTFGQTMDKPALTQKDFRPVSSKTPYSQKDFEPVRIELERRRMDAIAGIHASEAVKEPNNGYESSSAAGMADGTYDAAETDNAILNDTSANGVIYNEVISNDAVPSLFAGTRVIGQAFSTYILLERGDELLLLDQHAAHERIRYEELNEAYSKNEPLQQTLLSVISIELSGSEYQFAMNETEFFRKLGFTYESFGTHSIILRTIPSGEKGFDIKEVFLGIIDFVMNGSVGQRNAIADEVLYRMACKSAVKANKKLDDREIEALLNRLASLENPFTCPHGRPAILKLKRVELEKLFKRIV
jgi:DNA mismatch repair protein MutL